MSTQQEQARAEARRAVLGDEAPGGLAGAAFAAPLTEWAEAAVWDVWARPGLPLATRCIVTVTALATQNRPGLLAVHIRGALRNGVTAAQLGEIFTHLAVYAGVPAGADAMAVLKQVVEARHDGG